MGLKENREDETWKGEGGGCSLHFVFTRGQSWELKKKRDHSSKAGQRFVSERDVFEN